ncbi:unnamed protein product [Ectocarpus sp. CCAP 1310/34]|nr:unnamed protein product [Ectocarpus sp. CCAP 1310/34]
MSGRRGAGRPPKRKRAFNKAGQFTAAAAPPEPLAADTPPEHGNDTCYEGDEEGHSSSSQHSSDSDLGSCSSGSSGHVKYDGKSKRHRRRLRQMRRDQEDRRGVQTLLQMWAPPSSCSTPAPEPAPEDTHNAGDTEDGAVVFEIEGGGDDGDELRNWFGEEDMRDVDVCLEGRSSGSEGLIFGGYLGDSGDCSSGEDDAESNDAEEMPQQPLEGFPQQPSEGAQQDPLEGCPPGPADQNSAARRSPRILPTATCAPRQRTARSKGRPAGPGRGKNKEQAFPGKRSKGSRKRERESKKSAKRRAEREAARVQAQEERLKIFAKGKDILFPAVRFLRLDHIVEKPDEALATDSKKGHALRQACAILAFLSLELENGRHPIKHSEIAALPAGVTARVVRSWVRDFLANTRFKIR